jgi:hypothetical protein
MAKNLNYNLRLVLLFMGLFIKNGLFLSVMPFEPF